MSADENHRCFRRRHRVLVATSLERDRRHAVSNGHRHEHEAKDCLQIIVIQRIVFAQVLSSRSTFVFRCTADAEWMPFEIGYGWNVDVNVISGFIDELSRSIDY